MTHISPLLGHAWASRQAVSVSPATRRKCGLKFAEPIRHAVVQYEQYDWPTLVKVCFFYALSRLVVHQRVARIGINASWREGLAGRAGSWPGRKGAQGVVARHAPPQPHPAAGDKSKDAVERRDDAGDSTRVARPGRQATRPRGLDRDGRAGQMALTEERPHTRRRDGESVNLAHDDARVPQPSAPSRPTPTPEHPSCRAAAPSVRQLSLSAPGRAWPRLVELHGLHRPVGGR